MDDKTYWRLFSPGSCSCGKTFGRNMLAEAVHRHNFPALCKRKRKRAAVAAVLVGVALSSSPADACHRYSIWKYPFPQPRCGVTVDRSWYVEVTNTPVEPVKPAQAQEPDQRTPDQIEEAKEHDEMVRENKDYLNALMKLLRESEGKQ